MHCNFRVEMVTEKAEQVEVQRVGGTWDSSRDDVKNTTTERCLARLCTYIDAIVSGYTSTDASGFFLCHNEAHLAKGFY